MEKEVIDAINRITYFTSKFPGKEFRIISDHPELATPYLLEAIRKAIRERDELGNNYELHFYAMYLLAQFECREAFPLILDMISLPAEVLDGLIGDCVTSGLSDILYSTYDGNFKMLKEYIIYKNCDPYAKTAALDVCMQLYKDSIVEKSVITDILYELIHDPVCEDDGTLDTHMIVNICDCHFVEMLKDIQYLFDEGRADEYVMGDYSDCVDAMFDYSDAHERFCKKITSAEDELKGWSMFEQSDKDQKRLDADLDNMLRNMMRGMNKQEKSVKIYPNDPCPCGSGKKYKKCCMNRSKEELEAQAMEMDRKKWLEDYPKTADPRVEGRIYLQDFYDQDSIAVDQSVYLALKERSGLPSVRESEEERIKRQTYYLLDAFDKWKAKCEQEGLSSIK